MNSLAKFVKEDPKRTFWYLILLGVVIVISIYAIPKLLVILLPFILALGISRLCTPIVDFLKTKLHIPPSVASLIVILAIIGILGYLLFITLATLISELYELVEYLPELLHKNNIELSGTYLSSLILKGFSYLPESVRGFANYICDSFENYIKSMSEPVLKNIVGIAKAFAGKLPSFFIFLASLVLSSYFVMSDSERVNSLLLRYVPDRVRSFLKKVLISIRRVFVYYIKSRIIIGFITFVILLVGFNIISVKSPSITALGVCFADALPVIGLGGVMLPWSLWCMITGTYTKGTGILVIYAVAIVIRRILEPKIVSRQMGVHPLLTVFLMYAGYKLFSGFGLIFFPLIGVTVINIINTQKYTNTQNEVKN